MSDTEGILAQENTHCSGRDITNGSRKCGYLDTRQRIKTDQSEATNILNRVMMDRKGNFEYHKSVHDIRDGQGKVNGQTDDCNRMCPVYML